jgi:type III secretion protein L
MALAILIDREDLRVTSDRKIIKASEYLTLADAQCVLARADREAEAVLAAAKSCYEEQRIKGYEDGLARAQRAMAAEIAAIAAHRARLLQSLQTTLVDAVMGGLARILHDVDQQWFFEQALRQVASFIRSEKSLTLRVCPAQEGAARAAVDAMMRGSDTPAFVLVSVDESLALGACVLESESGVVDASLETQLEAIRRSLIASFGANTEQVLEERSSEERFGERNANDATAQSKASEWPKDRGGGRGGRGANVTDGAAVEGVSGVSAVQHGMAPG